MPGEDAEFSGVHTMPVYDDEFFVVLPARHRLAAAAEVPFAALAAEQWVVSSETGTCPDVRVFQQACRRAGFIPSVTFRSEDYPTVQGLVAANLGVSLVPSLAAAPLGPTWRCGGWPVRVRSGAYRWQRRSARGRGSALAPFWVAGAGRRCATRATKPYTAFLHAPFSVA